jgi:hypothetical protein
MKKLMAILLIASTSVVYADGFHHSHRGGYRGDVSGNWVAPMIIGGVVTYVLTHPTPTPPPQVIYVPTGPGPVSYSATPPFGYHWEQVLDANCNCYRVVAVPN